MSTVVPIHRSLGVVLTKRQLARHLARSSRWIELKVNQGMPSIAPTERYRQRRFVLADVEAWLTDSRAKRPSTAERVAVLEAEVASLMRMVDELRLAK